jgi:hypothetical protein
MPPLPLRDLSLSPRRRWLPRERGRALRRRARRRSSNGHAWHAFSHPFIFICSVSFFSSFSFFACSRSTGVSQLCFALAVSSSVLLSSIAFSLASHHTKLAKRFLAWNWKNAKQQRKTQAQAKKKAAQKARANAAKKEEKKALFSSCPSR